MSAPGTCSLSIAVPPRAQTPRSVQAGSMVRFVATITDITGAAADPTTVTFTVGTSYADVVTLSTVHDGTGQYHADWDTTSASQATYYCDVVGTGTLDVAAEVSIAVKTSHL